MASVENGPVMDHVQAFADEGEQFGIVFKTYNGHSPTRDRALDCWGSLAARRAIVEFFRANYKRFGGDYAIHLQQIWNPEILNGWRWMADRGNKNDANHMQHAHFSFEAKGAAQPHRPTAPVPASLPPMISMGDRGDAVRLCQTRLRAHGHQLTIDGIFGPHTRARVQIHQAAWRLVPDGIVGPATWPTLLVNLT